MTTKIICVDDNPALVEILSEMLKVMDYDTRTVPGGEECLSLLRNGSFHPDLIFLDIMMEPMDGWQTLHQIRGELQFSAVPVVMLTGKYPTMDEVNKFCHLIDGYLMKPFALERLIHETGEVLSRVKSRDEVIRIAWSNGVDELLLEEYRRLSSMVVVLKHFEKIIRDGTFQNELLDAAEKRFKRVSEKLKKPVL